jgi:hypothetical protein
MVALDCSDPAACPSCWHFRSGRCSLLDLLRGAVEPALHALPVAQRGLAPV